jgi:hypothetical protein
MALGALVVVESVASDGPLFVDRVTLVGDGAYPTNGSAGLAAKLKAAKKDGREIVSVVDEGIATNKYEYDKANDKIKAFVRATGVEVANAVDLSGQTLKLCITSK